MCLVVFVWQSAHSFRAYISLILARYSLTDAKVVAYCRSFVDLEKSTRASGVI